MITLSFAVLCLAFPATLGMMTPSKNYTFHKSMNAQGSYHLYWEYDSHMITFEIIANTTGFVGLGWSPKGSMAYADIIVASVDDRNGKLTLKDCHGQNRNGEPNCTEESNLIPVVSKQDGYYTMVQFRRKLDTCDPDDRAITDGTLRMIWSMGKTDVLEYHGSNRGSRSMRLIGMRKPYENIPPNTKKICVLQENFLIPAEETRYECIIRELPKLDKKHHIIKIDPVIQHKENVHHMILHACSLSLNNMTQNMSTEVNKTSICYPDSTVAASARRWSHSKCTTIFNGWAVGAESYNFPKEAGLPIGTDEDPRYVKLEIHYNNPKLEGHKRDSSGMCLLYTDELRPNDAGVVAMGKLTTESHLIPPGQSNFVSSVYTPKGCTDKEDYLGNLSEVYINSVFPHSHYAGRAIRHRHFRNGEELPYIYDDQTYDFDFQNAVVLPERVTVQPGDQFLVECTYNTMNRVNATLGGEATTDEMCISFVLIYPKIPLTAMYSTTNYDELVKLYTNNRKDDRRVPQDIPWWDALQSNIKWDTNGNVARWWQTIERNQRKYWGVCGTREQIYKNYKDSNPPHIPEDKIYKPPVSPCKVVIGSADTVVPRSHLLVVFSVLALIVGNKA